MFVSDNSCLFGIPRKSCDCCDGGWNEAEPFEHRRGKLLSKCDEFELKIRGLMLLPPPAALWSPLRDEADIAGDDRDADDARL